MSIRFRRAGPLFLHRSWLHACSLSRTQRHPELAEHRSHTESVVVKARFPPTEGATAVCDLPCSARPLCSFCIDRGEITMAQKCPLPGAFENHAQFRMQDTIASICEGSKRTRLVLALSACAAVMALAAQAQTIDHAAGFASHGDLTANGSTTFVGSLARLTSGFPHLVPVRNRSADVTAGRRDHVHHAE
jgi:hypothetical protein